MDAQEFKQGEIHGIVRAWAHLPEHGRTDLRLRVILIYVGNQEIKVCFDWFPGEGSTEPALLLGWSADFLEAIRGSGEPSACQLAVAVRQRCRNRFANSRDDV